METVVPINNDSPRHRRRHSRHHSNLSLGTMSLTSLTIEDESEEPQIGHNRKMSFQEIPHSLAWSMSDGSEEEPKTAEDDRQDARERLLTDEDYRRDRFLSEEGGRERLVSDDNVFDRQNMSFDTDLNRRNDEAEFPEQGFEVQLSDELVATQPLPCFRDSVSSCPEMPRLRGGMDDSGRVSLVLRRARAFSEDTGSCYLQNSMDVSSGSVRIRSYDRSDSMLIDQKYGLANVEPLIESPTSVWIYWEENLENPMLSSTFAAAFQTRQF